MMLALIGAGNMGGALLSGWLAAGWSADDIVVVQRSTERAEQIEQQFGVRRVSLDEAAQAATIVVAVKPYQFDDVLAALNPKPGALVVSVAAGVTVARLRAALPDGTPSVRVMPNTGALVGACMSGIVPGANATDEHVQRVQELFNAVGETLITDEQHLDALTALSGSGPAYLFYIADAMIEAGVHQGLTRADATTLTTQTFLAAAELLAQSGKTAVELREQVTSPGGTTAAALRALDDHGVRAAVMDAVDACAARAKALAREG